MHKEIVNEVKKKKCLKNLDDKIILNCVIKHYKGINKKKDKKELIKKVRAELHFKYGMFWLSDKLELKAHKSSKDRLKIYPTLYKEIFQITGKPKVILDLGCGLNPLSYNYLECKPLYIASEWNKKDCNKITDYFKKNNIKGKVLQLDLRKDFTYPRSDIVFLFSVFDIIETKGHKLAEKIIKALKSKYVVVSFSTKTFSNKKMNYPKRGWIERMLKRLDLRYKKLSYMNEIFYVIKLVQ